MYTSSSLVSATLALFGAKINTKDVTNILLISKEEAIALNQMGIPYGKWEGISHSYTKNRKYYLCEKKDNLLKLDKYRKSLEK